nr:MAG TPA: hypothetical protein [Caudoviricetes sp.]
MRFSQISDNIVIGILGIISINSSNCPPAFSRGFCIKKGQIRGNKCKL